MEKNKQKWMITGVTPMTMEAPPYESLSKWIDDHAPRGLWISLQNHQMSRMFDHILKIAPFFEGDPASKHENSGPKCYTGGPHRGSAPVREGKSALREAGPILTPTHWISRK